MKRKILTCLSIGSLLMSAAMCVSFSLNQKEYKVEAYTTSALPTTIDLNDSSTTEIQAYYASLSSLASTERSGNNLLKNLKPILKEGQKYYSYDTGGDNIWKMYEITDRDWTKSPASAISGYNATSNTITGFVYGSSASSPGDNPYIHALYINRNADNNVRAWYNSDNPKSNGTSHGSNIKWNIDREHIWPKSQGFEASGKGGARGDPMHLWAGDSHVNSALHNDHCYGYVDTSRDYTDGKDKYENIEGNKYGYSLTFSDSATKVFEPQDSDKGDIARAVFYMVARYNYLSSNDSDGITSDNPNLELVNAVVEKSKYSSTETTLGQMGILSDLLAWNELDPPDEYEIHRNNLLYKNFTNNRNPFIDYPEWANIIWGNKEGYADPYQANGLQTSGESSGNEGNNNPGPTTEPTTEPEGGFKLTTPIIIAIAVGAVVVLVIVIIILAKSKKARKLAKKTAKKQVKKAVKNSTSKKKK